MNFYTLASKLNKKIENVTKQFEQCGQDEQTGRELGEKLVMNEFEKNTRLGIQLMIKYKQIAQEEGLFDKKTADRYFFVTIRPDQTKVTFETFKNDVLEYLQRKMFIKYYCTFEQKGKSHDTLGEGFHTHIIAMTKQRSKGEMLRDTHSSFKKYCEKNFIQVDICYNPEELKQNYLIDYASDDGHKIVTKSWDTIWRYKNNIESFYGNTLLTSPGR